MTVFTKLPGRYVSRLAIATSPGDYFIFSTCFRVARGNGNERRRMFISGRALRLVIIVVAAVVHAFNPRDNDGVGMLSLNS